MSFYKPLLSLCQLFGLCCASQHGRAHTYHKIHVIFMSSEYFMCVLSVSMAVPYGEIADFVARIAANKRNDSSDLVTS